MNADDILNAALEVTEPDKRRAYLDRACAGDGQLRTEIESLLAAHERLGGFLNQRPALPSRPGILPEAGTEVAITESPGDHIDRYKLLEKIGEGGCGVVYMAEQEEPVRRKIALKIIKLGLETKSVIARFEAERQALAMMDHPNIAKIFDGGVTESRSGVSPAPAASAAEGGASRDGGTSGRRDARPTLRRPYFVMELVRGVRITDYCEQHQLSTRARLDLFIQVCSAIQHAHQKGVIHRDIKPSNVLVTEDDHGTPVPKVIDFGIAKATEQKLTDKTLFTQFAQFIGTPAYMSPEQAALTSIDIDTRADIYSLGVLLYELLTGTTPFDAQELLKSGFDEMRRVIRETEPEKPSTRLMTRKQVRKWESEKVRETDAAANLESPLPTFPPAHLPAATTPTLNPQLKPLSTDLDWIVMKCLEKDRARRYETANGLAADLQRHLSNEPVVARPPSAAYRFQKMVRRNKVAFTAAAAVAAALVIGLSLSVWQGIEKTRAYRRALAAEQEQSRLRREAESARKTEATLRAQAEANEKRALSEATKSQQVARFLKDMLGAAGPSVARGRDTQMLREILDKTAERVSQDLKDQPEVEADLRTIIGNAYADLGAHDQAGVMFSEALAIRRRVLGPKHKDVAASLNDFGGSLRLRGEMGGAESQAREAMAMSRELLGPQNLETARSLHTLALVAWKRHELIPAEAMAREALEIRRRLLGLEHPDVAYSLGAVGIVLTDQSRLTEAEAVLREELAMLTKLLGGDHKDVAGPLNNLASVLVAQGNRREAEAMFRELVVREKKLLGINHPHTMWQVKNVTSMLLQQGEFVEAREFLQQLRSSEAPSPATAGVLFRMEGEIYAQRGQGAEAIVAFRSAIQSEPTNHQAYHCLAPVLIQTGEIEGYRQLCRQMRTVFGGTKHPGTGERMAKACTLLPPAATELAVIDQWADVAITSSPGTGWFQLAKGLADFRHGRFQSAVEWLRQSLLHRDLQRHGIPEAVLAMALHHLNQTEDAHAALAKALEHVQKRLPRRDTGDLGERANGWLDAITADILLREARELIEGGTPKPTVAK